MATGLSRDGIEATAQFRRRLLQALAAGLPRGGAVLALGLPGQAAVAGLDAPGLGHRVIEALTGDLLATRADQADSLLAGPAGALVVGTAAAAGRAGRGVALGSGIVPVPGAVLHQRRLSDLLADLRGPVLVLADPQADAGGLLRPCLAALAAAASMLWVDLPAGPAGDAWAAALLADPAAADFACFGLDPERGVVAAGADGAGLAALILLPRAAWSGQGLAALAAVTGLAAQAAALRAPAARWRMRGGDDAVAAAIMAAGRVPQPPQGPDKIFLPAGARVFAAHARPVPIAGEDGIALDTGGLGRVRLAFLAPAPGVFRLRVALISEPDRPLVLRTGTVTVATDWVEDWFQLRAHGLFQVADPREPVEIALAPAAGNDGLRLHIKGIELEYVEQGAAAAIAAGPERM